MAGAKLSPRMKMISLMYLVFIAMLALNMSKEVLSAFGLMNEKFESSNNDALASNTSLYDALSAKASETPTFAEAKKRADQVKAISNSFYAYLGKLKTDITTGIERENGKLPYETMDKGDKIDEGWFAGDGYSKKGTEIVSTIDKYRNDMIAVVGNDPKYKGIVSELNSKFSTADIKDREGVTKKYLDYNYKGFPSIASLTKLSAMQNDVEVIEASLYNNFLGKAAVAATSMNNYKAIVITDKSAFFSGEAVTGMVVLGRYDANTVPTKVVVNGANQPVENGQVKFKFGAGNVGEHKINGSFTFMEDGKAIDIPVEGNYVVVPKPNSATISADKMNVVYRGVTNPMTISFAGISADKVSASGAGLSPAGKPGSYTMKPGAGNEVVINVTGKLADGTSVSDKKSFRIKGIPGPVGTIRGEVGNVKGAKSNLEIATIGAKLEDFDFEVGLNVVGFNIKAPGQPTIVVSGNKLDARAKASISKAGRGDLIVVSEIKTKLEGAGSYMLPRTAPVFFEIQ